MVGKKDGLPLILGKREEAILKAVHFYRYMTAVDVCYLLYSPASLSYVRKVLRDLAGGGDHVLNAHLYRFSLPGLSLGNSYRVYTLGARGRAFLTRECGMEVDWYFRPHKVKGMGFIALAHNLLLTRFLVAADRWCKSGSGSGTGSGYDLLKVRICYELGSGSESSDEDDGSAGKRGESAAVIPDGWLLFERRRDQRRFPVLLEIDHGTAFKRRFQQHVAGRIAYVKKGGDYARIFGTGAVVIAYATTGERAEYRETRRQSMCRWTMEVLRELKKENWAPVFRFHSLSLEEIYEMRLFTDRVWYRPDMEEPVGLLG